MRIEELKIESFGRLQDFTLTPGQALNVIAGDNESGKSTLSAFIRYMLYGFGRASATEVGEKRKRLPWQGGRAAGSMVVEVGGKRYRLERSTVAVAGPRGKDDYHESSSIIDLATNTPLPSGACPGERFLGVPESVFLETAFVGQIDSPRPDGSSLTGAIENLLFSGDEKVSLPRALDKLDALRRTLLHKKGKGGELNDLREMVAELEGRLARARQENAALLDNESHLAATRREKAEIEERYKAARAKEQEETCVLLVLAYDRLHVAEKKLALAEAALIDMDGLPSERLGERDLTDLAIARHTAEETTRRLAEADRAVTGAEREPCQTEEEKKAWQRAKAAGGEEAISAHAGGLFRRFLSLLAGACGLFAGGVLLLTLFLALPALSGMVILPAFGGLLAVGALALALPAISIKRDLSALCHSYGASGRRDLSEVLFALHTGGEKEEERLALLAAAKEKQKKAELDHRRAVGELDTVVRRFNTRLPQGEVGEFLDDLSSRVRGMLEKKKEREKEKTESAALVEALRERLRGTNEAAARAGLPAGELPPEESLHPEVFRKKAEELNVRRLTLAEAERELERSLLSARGRIEDPAVLGAALEGARTQLAQKTAQYNACQMAYAALSGAGERLRAEISPRLSQTACALMGEMTEGRYDRIGVADDLSLAVGTAGGTLPPDYLSAGTQDLLYLSLRMALIDLLYKEAPPLCFDESFAHQDDTRLSRAMAAIAAYAGEGKQCFLFTCHKREGEVAAAVAEGTVLIRMEA